MFPLLDWQFPAFLGIQNVSGLFRWQGRLTEPITYEWWNDNNPTGGERYCINVGPNSKYQFNDLPCEMSMYFFCEKESNC